jgi:hypothetical protein
MLPSCTRAALAHRRAGIGACFLMMTHARLPRSPSSASNSARPTVTVRPSGSGTAPPAASTAATSWRSAIKVGLDKGLDLAHERTNALGAPTVNEITAAQSQKPGFNRINSAQYALSISRHFSHQSAPWRRRNLAKQAYR